MHLISKRRGNVVLFSFVFLLICFGCVLAAYIDIIRYLPHVFLAVLLAAITQKRYITVLSNKPACCILLYEIYMIAISRLNKCGLMDGSYITDILLIFCLHEIISLDFRTFLKTAYGFSLIFFVLNTLSCVLCKNGIINNDLTRSPVYLLGTKNSMGDAIFTLMLLNTLYSKVYYNRLTKKVIITNIIGAIAPIYTKSATSVVGIGLICILGWIMYIESFKTILRKTSMFGIYIFGCILSYIFNVLQLQKYFAFFIEVILKKTITMSARTMVWDKTLLLIQNNKWFGYGAYQIKLLDVISFVAANAHSFALEVLLTGGIVGACLLAFVFAKLSDRRIMPEYQEHFNWIKCYMIVFMVMGISESTIYYSGFWMMIIISGYMQTEKSRKEQKQSLKSGSRAMTNGDVQL